MSEIVQLTLARRRDARRIAEMARDQIESGLGWSWGPARVRRQIDRGDALVVVARSGEALAGFGIMRYLEAEAHLLLLAVAPGQRRMGVGQRLLEWLERCALEAGIARVSLEVRERNAGAQAFYRNQGYQRLKLLEGYYRRPYRVENAVRMGKVLARPLDAGAADALFVALTAGLEVER